MAEAPHHHQHHHGHGAAQSHPPDNEAFTEANRAHWNDFASKYTSEPWQRDLLNKVTAFIHQHVNWIGVDFIDPSTTFETQSDTKQQIRVLDYACGPGTITHALAARATEYTGIDLSENMVKAYNVRFNPHPANKAGNTSSSADEAAGLDDQLDETLAAHAVVGNLLDSKDPSPSHLSSPEFFNFDLVAVGLGYHHFQDIQLATKRLVERLRPGGIFLILDFVTHAMEESSDPTKQSVKNTVAHAGFSEEELRSYFEQAGLTDFAIVKMDGEVLLRGEAKRRPFLARGRKH
ncbi:uncharacterized protein Z520_10528 [Fonsecaea multimorphosa CBS 102226]|uniref:Methyltransferase domain-containing protein n=1 Tax=Fonsecaea multimorphosa CBS 102226 TaxID=1442371 RepID=A0A0D2JK42_9EURO|nr:uncharacterized protein Z520_10528 [Fonsecaea multimorphosa CBS 102226]KIX93622.1 hypothetical protein Z520_10528 [Fonsecaea multimorphosa CBS 102226]OAL19737.1 hypothetical protein AYO22_09264 [Fonsecaea multimorphosa]